MDSEKIERLALDLEAEELLGTDKVLEAADIIPVLEVLWEKGVDLLPLIEEEEAVVLVEEDES